MAIVFNRRKYSVYLKQKRIFKELKNKRKFEYLASETFHSRQFNVSGKNV